LLDSIGAKPCFSAPANNAEERYGMAQFLRAAALPEELTAFDDKYRSRNVGAAATAEHLEKRPICVDLDGTLVHTDTLIEGLVAVVSNQRSLSDLSGLLTANRAVLKRRVAELTDCAAETLPYNQALIAYLREKRREGHRLVLATAADARVAKAIADHLGLFDDVISSDGTHNLKGATKAAALVKRFGYKGFDYVGNDRSDLPVWRAAAAIVAVNAPPAVLREARALGTPAMTFDTRPPLIRSLLRAMRPHQWSKNLLVFVPMITAHALTEGAAWIAAIALFLSLSATASALYIVNDILDLPSDRRHPRKRLRPVASGALPVTLAVAAAIVLLAIGGAFAWLAGGVLVVLVYATVSLTYSLWFKRFPLLDVFVLAALYTLRVLAGGIVTQHRATMWLMAFSGFTFLSLALVKRVGELLAIEQSVDKLGNARRGYRPGDGFILQMFGCASAFASSIVLALFVSSSAALQQYRAPEVLSLMVPIVLFWQCRLWLATVRGNMHDDPIVYATTDWVSWLVAVAILFVMFAAAAGITFP
jgi:4-hydroxybenzoate polyprenyltransferase/phosphoserine phosphatase